MKNNKRILIFTTFKKIVKIIYNVDRKYIYITTALVIFLSLLPVVSLKIMQSIINLIQTQIGNLNWIFTLVIFYLFIEFISMLLSAIAGYYKKKFELKFNIEMKRKVLDKASRLRLQDYESSEIYDMLQRAEDQTQGGLLGYFDTILGMVGSLITCVSFICIVFSFRFWIVPILVIIPIIRYVISNRINNEEFEMLKKRTKEERKAWYDSYIITCGMNYKELKLYNLFTYFIQKFENLMKEFAKQDLHIMKRRVGFMVLFSIAEQILIGCLFAFTIYCGFLGKIMIGDVLVYTKAMVSAKGQIQDAIQTIAELNKSCMFIGQLFEFMDLREEELGGDMDLDRIRCIEVKNLSFKYRDNEEYTLNNVTFKIEEGDFIAIVGRNGSGKSTLMKLLLGLYEEYEGEILINGVNLKKIDKVKYLSRIGALFQDFTKYEATIRENVCFSNLRTLENDEEIVGICNKFGLGGLLNEQGDGIDTQLGFWFESGKELSFGQWQKVALARAFNRDADLYFLDEPNAALDAISEHEMAELYEESFKNKMGIVIVHRFNNFVHNANKIIVLKDGYIDNIGDHDYLMIESEEYMNLYSFQE